ncbi:MAG: transposase, partial [Planctomycetales bacterium]
MRAFSRLGSPGGYCYHVLNRGNARGEVFHKQDDYLAFLTLIGRACERVPLRVIAYCLIPSHFHLVLWPHADGDLSRWMQWLLTSHVRRYRRHDGPSKRVNGVGWHRARQRKTPPTRGGVNRFWKIAYGCPRL